MKNIAELIYIGENFSVVFDKETNINFAYEVVSSVLLQYENKILREINALKNREEREYRFIQFQKYSENSKLFKIDEENNKLFIKDGHIGNFNNLVEEICMDLVLELPNSIFCGHSFYDDENSAYISESDYTYVFGKLDIKSITSENGDGTCPKCGEMIVRFDEYDPNKSYCCHDCDLDLTGNNLFEKSPVVNEKTYIYKNGNLELM